MNSGRGHHQAPKPKPQPHNHQTPAPSESGAYLEHNYSILACECNQHLAAFHRRSSVAVVMTRAFVINMFSRTREPPATPCNLLASRGPLLFHTDSNCWQECCPPSRHILFFHPQLLTKTNGKCDVRAISGGIIKNENKHCILSSAPHEQRARNRCRGKKKLGTLDIFAGGLPMKCVLINLFCG